MAKPPVFKDDLPTDPSTGDALRDAAVHEVHRVAGEANAVATGPSTPNPVPQADGPALPAQDLTPEESAAVAKVLFQPTIRRMGILVDTLITQSGNGDFGLWAPLAVLDAVLTTMPITNENRPNMAKFLRLTSLTLHTYASRLESYQAALLAGAETGVIPPPPSWETSDTLQMYDLTEAEGK